MGMMSKSLMRKPSKKIFGPDKPKKTRRVVIHATDGEAVAAAIAVTAGYAPFLPPGREAAIRIRLAELARSGTLESLVERRLQAMGTEAREAYRRGSAEGTWARLLATPVERLTK